MFGAEASWLERLLRERAPDELSPLLMSAAARARSGKRNSPGRSGFCSRPCGARGIQLIHLDARQGEGIDIKADILSETDLPRIKALRPKAILCCNILEHVKDPDALARRCIEIVGPGGFIFVTVPFSYPITAIPSTRSSARRPRRSPCSFGRRGMLTGEIVDVGESYRGQVKRRPWILFRTFSVFRFPS